VQGYLIGNPVTDDVFDGNAIVSFAHGMGLIPNDLFEVKTKPSFGLLDIENKILKRSIRT